METKNKPLKATIIDAIQCDKYVALTLEYAFMGRKYKATQILYNKVWLDIEYNIGDTILYYSTGLYISWMKKLNEGR